MRQLRLEEFQELLEQLELPSEEKQKLIDRIRGRGYIPYLMDKDEMVEVSRGTQYFGSGGFDAGFFKVIGDYEILEERKFKTGFIHGRTFKIKPKETPLIIVYYRKDECGGWDSPVRYFNRDIYVWL